MRRWSFLIGFGLVIVAVFGLWPAWSSAAMPPSRLQGEWEHAAYLPLIANGMSAGNPPGPTPPPPEEGWLAFLNYHRALAELPPLGEDAGWSDGCWKHARYMVKNDVLTHSEDPGNEWYTLEGALAAQSSNLAASYDANASDHTMINLWMRGPFHAIGILDPALLLTGYGSYREADGDFQTGAVQDVLRGLGDIPPGVQFPVIWPADGMTVYLNTHEGEYPDPLTSCPGYSLPTGLPLIVQIGGGELTPSVSAHTFSQGSTSLEHCVFDETNYTNSESAWQELGRSILDARDAVVLIPRQPLESGKSYTVSLTVNGQTYTWSFSVAEGQ